MVARGTPFWYLSSCLTQPVLLDLVSQCLVPVAGCQAKSPTLPVGVRRRLLMLYKPSGWLCLIWGRSVMHNPHQLVPSR